MKIEVYFIKGMICDRCIRVLKEILLVLGTEVIDIRLGQVQICYNPKEIKYSLIEDALQRENFEILKDRDSILAEQTKHLIFDFVWRTDQWINLSDYLSKELNKNYQVLSQNFSKIEGQSIERYHMKLKVEKVKELVEYNNLNFSEIAYCLGYQNAPSLSRQFKKEVGLSMKSYKEMGVNYRIPLNEI